MLVEFLDVTSLTGHEEQKGAALFASTSGAPHAMDVVHGGPWGSVLHDPVHLGQVQTSGGHILGTTDRQVQKDR